MNKSATNKDINLEEEPIDKFKRNLEFNIDENYEYVSKGKIFSFISNMVYYGIAFPILKILTKIVYNLKIEGKENIKNIKTGAISVSNHVLFLDCAIIGLATISKRIYYTTTEENFKIPFIRKLIKLLRAIPIPKSIKNREYFMNEIENLLRTNNIIHFYPEATLVPYCNKIRSFKNGAFDIAAKNQVPIIPMLFTFKEPKGIRKILKRKQDVILTILNPVVCKENIDTKDKAKILKRMVYEEMLEIS